MRFEKWQALGNDYLIVERDELPAPLTAAAVRRLCHPHLGVGADGVLELARSTEPGFAADLRIFNADGSEAELSGNGSRQAILWLVRHGWAEGPQFSVRTAAGEIRPTILSPSHCRVDMGRAGTSSPFYPDGPADGIGSIEAGGSSWTFRHVAIGNPQCTIRVDGVPALDALDLARLGPPIETSALFPQRTNVSWWAEIEPGRIGARIFERGVGETMSSGTGACGAAVDYVLRGADSTVTVVLEGGELEVEVGEDLHVDLTGWALPVCRGELSDELVEALSRAD